jgi:hypothetical protein
MQRIFLYISFSVWWSTQQTAGIPQQLWAHPCVVATRAPVRRAINGIAGRAGCRLVLARYTPCFWLDIRPVFG